MTSRDNTVFALDAFERVRYLLEKSGINETVSDILPA
jgi:hypothetical protein